VHTALRKKVSLYILLLLRWFGIRGGCLTQTSACSFALGGDCRNVVCWRNLLCINICTCFLLVAFFLILFFTFFHRGHLLLRRVSSLLYLSGGSSFFNHVRFACLSMSLYGSLLVFYWQAIFCSSLSLHSYISSLLIVCYSIVLGCWCLQCIPVL